MFEPTERENLLDLLRPPEGYRLDAAIGTTYSLDFVTLTAAMLAFVDAETDDGDPLRNDVEVLRAITRLSHRVRVFVNRGQISLSGASETNRLFPLYDRVVREVRFAVGRFHPKVWVVKYCPRDIAGAGKRSPVVRIICSSRNLTTCQNWEIYASFEGEQVDLPIRTALATSVAAFLRRLLTGTDNSERCPQELLAALGHVQISLPREMTDQCDFLWQWGSENALWRRFPAGGDGALIVSPFVRKRFLEDVMDRFDRVTLVSTQHELDVIADDAFHRRLKDHDVFVVQPADADDGTEAMGLHAKLFICQGADATQVFLGSANASHRGWREGNCEAVVAFAPGVSIDHFRRRFILDDDGRLNRWLEEYVRREHRPDETETADCQLDRIRDALSGLRIRANYDRETESLRLVSGDAALSENIRAWRGQFRFRICPLSLFVSESAFRDIGLLFSTGIEFSGVAMDGLSAFVLLDIMHESLQLQRRFLIKAETDFEGLLDARDAAILRRHLTKDKFQQFLWAILLDGTERSWAEVVSRGPADPDSPTGTPQFLAEATIEDVLQSCTSDPSRISEISQLLDTFKATGFVEPDFLHFWGEFLAAFKEVDEGVSRG